MGFFFSEARKKLSNRRTVVSDSDAASYQSLYELECAACPRNDARAQSPKMKPSGGDRPTLYFLGTQPCADEDAAGDHLKGRMWRYVLSHFPSLTTSDIRINTCLRTYSPAEKPTNVEIMCCRKSVEEDIVRSGARIVVGFGSTPLHWMLRDSSLSISAWRGCRIPAVVGEQDHSVWFYPVEDPLKWMDSERKHDEASGELQFRLDLRRIDEDASKGRLGRPSVIRKVDAFEGLTTFDGTARWHCEAVRNALKKFGHSRVPVAVDVETSSLRPYDGRLLTCAVSDGFTAVAFAVEHSDSGWTGAERRSILKALREFVSFPAVKVAHNLSFDLEWLGYVLGTEWFRSTGWGCTMAGAYVLDERRTRLSLDLQVLERFGQRFKGFTGVGVKNIEAESLRDVLLYNGLDAKFTARLFKEQQKDIREEGLGFIYDEQVRRIWTIVLMQLLGLCVDDDAVRALVDEYKGRVADVERRISSDEHVALYAKHRGKRFNPRSNAMLLDFFFRFLKIQLGLLDNVPQSESVDESVLKKIGHPVSNMVLELRKLDKLSNYVEPLLPGGKHMHADGLIHTVYNSTFTNTGRLSSAFPNIQNFPQHEHKEVRRVVVPPDGCRFLKLDYGQIEARVIAMASRDPFLVKALHERYDIHMVWAEKYAMTFPKLVGGRKFVRDAEAMKKFRSRAKNEIVFPAFYGAGVKSIARSLDVDAAAVEKLFDEFWMQFSGVKEWQHRMLDFYTRRGYVECLTGRRRHGPLSRTMIFNTPIQGTASDIVVDAMNRLSEKAQFEDKPSLHPVMNIHDDLTMCVHKDEWDDSVEDIVDVVLSCPFEFVNVPLSIELSCGDNWADMVEISTIFSDEWFGHEKTKS